MKTLFALLQSQSARRLRGIASAQLFNQLTTVVAQLALVPVLLHAWGKETYGIWLLLSALPTYLTFSDLGFTLVAKNEMLMQVAGGSREAALRTFHSVFALLNLIVPGLVVVSVLLILSVDLSALMKLGGYQVSDARLVIVLLLLNVLAYQYFLLICGGVRCENRIAAEATWGASSRLGEAAILASAALLGGNLIVAAAVTLGNRLLFCLAMYAWMRRKSPWLWLGHQKADRVEVRRLLHPALAFMLMPISQALLIQGPILIIGALINPVAVVTFATTRTLTRVGTAASSMLNGTLQGEYGHAFGRGDAAALGRVFRFHQICSLVLVPVYCLFMWVLREPMMRLYTHGQVGVVGTFYALMLLTVSAEMLWASVSNLLTSVNFHSAFAQIQLATAVVGMGLCYAMTSAWQLNGAAAAMLAVHSFTLLVSHLLRHGVRLPQRDLAGA
jgi:O-antigen/teichoic acid export membrane protein